VAPDTKAVLAKIELDGDPKAIFPGVEWGWPYGAASPDSRGKIRK